MRLFNVTASRPGCCWPSVGHRRGLFLLAGAQAVLQAFYVEDPFGLGRTFVAFENFARVLASAEYYRALGITVASASAWRSAHGAGTAAGGARRPCDQGAHGYKTLLIWPYAVAPAVAGVLWMFMLDPELGLISAWLGALGIDWNHQLNGGQAMALVVMASIWKQMSYNFVFFLAGLQAIPRSLLEAAAIDNAGPWRRFWTITFPLLSPTSFFLLVMNSVYAFFETFGTIDATTAGALAAPRERWSTRSTRMASSATTWAPARRSRCC